MSFTQLLLATRDKIRKELNLSPDKCNVQIVDSPPPSAGDLYIAVFPKSWSPGDVLPTVTTGIDEVYALGVCLTQRINQLPFDYVTDQFIKEISGFEAVARKIIQAVHFQYDILTQANSQIGVHKFIEPLIWTAIDMPPSLVSGSWFGSEDEASQSKIFGMTSVITFSGSRRIQPLDDDLE